MPYNLSSIWYISNKSGGYVGPDQPPVNNNLSKIEVETKTCNLQSVASGKYLNAYSDSISQVRSSDNINDVTKITVYGRVNGDACQDWTPEALNGSYMLKLGSTNFYLNAFTSGNPVAGTNITIYNKVASDPGQMWDIYESGSDFVIALKSNKDLVLTVNNPADFPNPVAGAITVEKYTGADNQKWRGFTKKAAVITTVPITTTTTTPTTTTLVTTTIPPKPSVTADDIITLKEHILGISSIPAKYAAEYDMNGDGVLDSFDLAIMRSVIN